MEEKRTKFEDQIIRRRKRKFLTFAIMLVVIFGLCYLFVWERVYTLRLAEENAQTRQRVRNLKERSQSLEFEINQLSSVRRIEDIARRDLALLPPREVQLAGFTMSSRSGTPTDSVSVKPKTSDKPQSSAKLKGAVKSPRIDKKQQKTKPKADGKAAKPKPKAQK